MAKITQIVIGDEILSGKIQDLNLKFLAKTLLPSGHSLIGAKIIGDDSEQIIQTLEESSIENDVLIITGGLGPTKDDLTKAVLGKWLGSEIIESKAAIEIVTKQYKRMGREWSSELNNYHLMPKDISPIYNPNGFAPGLFLTKNNCFIFAAPGVPREFQAMLVEEIIPKINQLKPLTNLGFELLNIRTFGIPEEVIFGKLCPTLWDDLEKYAKVSSLPGLGGVDITLKIAMDSELENKKKYITNLINQSEIKESIWHIGMKELSELIVEEANAKNLTFSFAESCTGGLVSSMITDISGCSQCFLGSVISYDNNVKINQLGVNPDTLNQHGAVSLEAAKEMAMGVRKKIKSDFSISFSGIAGPTGGTKDKPVGTVAIGLSTNERDDSKIFHFPGDRLRLKQRFAVTGLFKLLQLIRAHN